MKRRSVILLGLLALAGGVMRAEIIEQILVKVNGEVFTKSDLEARQVVRLRELQGQNPDRAGDNSEELRKRLDDVTPEILVEVVDEMLVVQRGKELGYTLSDPQFQSVLRQHQNRE